MQLHEIFQQIYLQEVSPVIQAEKGKTRVSNVKNCKKINYLLTGKLNFSKVNADCLTS